MKTVVSPLGGPPRCGQCGKDLSAAIARDAASRAEAKPADGDSRRTIHPRELLARWAREESLPPLELGTPASAMSIEPPEPQTPPPALGAPAPQPVRYDASHPRGPTPQSLPQQISAAPPAPTPVPPMTAPHFSSTSTPHYGLPGTPPATPYSSPQQHNHPGHATLSGPHFSVSVIPQRAAANSMFSAQVILFIGVMGLTLGTSMLLYTHFWSSDTDALLVPGWVVAAVSQLMLLLGVVMLVSAGLKQASSEVAWRVESLGERLNRIEFAANHGDGDDRKGPL